MVAPILAAYLLAGRAVASEVDDMRENVETVVRGHVASKSRDGEWVFDKAGSPTLRLRLEGLERGTVHRVSPGIWSAVADFRDSVSKKRYFAAVDVDMGGDLWSVKKLHWLSRKEVVDVRASSAKAAASRAAVRKPGPEGLLPELSLTSLDGHSTSLTDCPTAKCLTVVVSPWCPHCQAVTGVLRAMQQWLPAHGVKMRVIVNHDSPEHVRAYAEQFGPATMIDPDVEFRAGGVPAFYVSTDGGAVLKHEAGAWESETDPARYSSNLGLP